MTEVIQHSDNVGMVFVAEKLGLEKMLTYIKKFGFGQLTGIDLQGEAASPLRPDKEWRKIDLATAAFGQGIAVTPIQLLTSVAAIANQGELVRPFVVQKVIDEEKVIEIKPKTKEKVIKASTARLITEMMINAVENGPDHWQPPKNFKIAGKTGTAQIPVAGHYEEERTIASFIGFAPANNPKFAMLVVLNDPKTSPWGAGTAAPLWFEIADELLTYYNLLPE